MREEDLLLVKVILRKRLHCKIRLPDLGKLNLPEPIWLTPKGTGVFVYTSFLISAVTSGIVSGVTLTGDAV